MLGIVVSKKGYYIVSSTRGNRRANTPLKVTCCRRATETSDTTYKY
jgi:hypothetical protein